MKSNELNVLVLHKVVDDIPVNFFDISFNTLNFILSKSSYKFVSIEKAIQVKVQEANNICLTFDDGFSSDYRVVLPELKKFKATATFFIVTDFLNTPGYLTTSQVKVLSESGMQIGSHSKTHPNFLSLTSDERMFELTTSKSILEETIGREVTAFSFPFGSFDQNCTNEVFAAGYRICCNSQHGVSVKSDSILARNSINAKTTNSRIDKILTAGYLQRKKWYLEDIIKPTLKQFSPRLYVILRNFFSRF